MAWRRLLRWPPCRPRLEPTLSSAQTGLSSRDERTKTDLGYHLPIRYYGPTGSFRRYSALKLLHGDVDAASLRGQVVVVGMTAAGLGDTFATPFDRVAPGVEIFATAISNLLSGDTLARTPSTRRIDAVMAAGLPVAMIAFISMRRAAVGLALAALVFRTLGGSGLSCLCQWLLAQHGIASCHERTADRRLYRRPISSSSAIRDERQSRKGRCWASFSLRFWSTTCSASRNSLDKPVRQDVAVMFLDLTGSTGVVEAAGTRALARSSSRRCRHWWSGR